VPSSARRRSRCVYWTTAIKGFDLVFLRHIRFSLGNVMKFDAELPILEFSGFVRQGSCPGSSRRLLDEGRDNARRIEILSTPTQLRCAIRGSRPSAMRTIGLQLRLNCERSSNGYSCNALLPSQPLTLIRTAITSAPRRYAGASW
jgi:hypothetical protein